MADIERPSETRRDEFGTYRDAPGVTRRESSEAESAPSLVRLPDELADRFKFARQRSKLAGTIRGSYFVIKGEH